MTDEQVYEMALKHADKVVNGKMGRCKNPLEWTKEEAEGKTFMDFMKHRMCYNLGLPTPKH